jgi:hypothetical protein
MVVLGVPPPCDGMVVLDMVLGIDGVFGRVWAVVVLGINCGFGRVWAAAVSGFGGLLLYTSLAVLFSISPIPIILFSSLCISMMRILLFGAIFLLDISLGEPYIHFRGFLYSASYARWLFVFHS